MPTGMALSYMRHIKWCCQLVSQISGRPPQPTLHVPAEQVSGQAPTAEQVSGQGPTADGCPAAPWSTRVVSVSSKQRVPAAAAARKV